MIDPIAISLIVFGLVCFGAGLFFGVWVERTARSAAEAELERLWKLSK